MGISSPKMKIVNIKRSLSSKEIFNFDAIFTKTGQKCFRSSASSVFGITLGASFVDFELKNGSGFYLQGFIAGGVSYLRPPWE